MNKENNDTITKHPIFSLIKLSPITIPFSALVSFVFVYRTAANSTNDDVVATLQIIKSYSAINILIVNIVPVATVISLSLLIFALPIFLIKVSRKVYYRIPTFMPILWRKRIPWSNQRYWTKVKVPIKSVLLTIISIVFYSIVDIVIMAGVGNFLQAEYKIKEDINVLITSVAFQIYVTFAIVHPDIPKIINSSLVAALAMFAVIMPTTFISDTANIPSTCIFKYEELENGNLDYTIMHNGIYLSDSGKSVTLLVKETIEELNTDTGETEAREIWTKQTIDIQQDQMLAMSACTGR